MNGGTSFLFDGFAPLGRTLVVGVLAYAALIFVLRVSGKRTLSKMNAFDFVVTVALGSTLATILLSKDVTLAEGVLALTLLVGLQWVISWSSTRSRWVSRLVKSEPSLLAYRGELLADTLRAERILEDEVLAAVRGGGVPSLGDVEAVVLETDGSMTVLPKGDGVASALGSVARFEVRGGRPRRARRA